MPKLGKTIDARRLQHQFPPFLPRKQSARPTFNIYLGAPD